MPDFLRRHIEVLFICRKSDYHFGHHPHPEHPYHRKATGLRQSALYCKEVLNLNGIPAEMVIVNDNNEIDREVTRYRPRWVIIEALWVVPEKFEVLKRLHPNVRWVIRLHSELPFVASEGPAMDWVNRYAQQSMVHVSANSDRMQKDLETVLGSRPKERVLYLPNCFVFSKIRAPKRSKNTTRILDICCFGAIRPMKNQLLQAVAALRFAGEQRKFLRFHMNSDRVEGVGDPVKKNIEQLFKYHRRVAALELHPWIEHHDLVAMLPNMDLAMQVSFTETFNHMAAEAAALYVPIVVSPEVRWASSLFKADPTSVDDVVAKMYRAQRYAPWLKPLNLNRSGLEKLARNDAKIWIKTFK